MSESRAAPPIQPLYKPLKHSRWGPPPEVVRRNQLMRLRGATIEAVLSVGYEATSVRRINALAGVSRKTLYEHFPQGKQQCFLATYDFIVARAAERVSAAWKREDDWRAGLRAAFAELAELVVEHPKAARFALVEALGAGPVGIERMDRMRALFERMVGVGMRQEGGVAPPAAVIKGIVCGGERVIRRRLLAGRERELPGLAEELMAWALSYQSPAAATLTDPAAPRRFARREQAGAMRSSDERVQMLRVAAQIAAEDGYRCLSHGKIASRLELPEAKVRARCGEIEECFLSALELLGLEALISAAKASRQGEDRLSGVALGIAALLEHVACNQVLCRICFVEVFAVGPAAIPRRDALLGEFTKLLVGALPKAKRPSEVVAEAIVGGIWGVLHHQVTHERIRSLPSLAGHCAYLALAPSLGGEQAMRAISAAEGSGEAEAKAESPQLAAAA